MTAPVTAPRTVHAGPELETERLRFRMLNASDFPTYETWCADIDVMRYIGGKTLERVLAWRHLANLLGHWSLLGHGYYAVEEKSTGTLVGRVGYTSQPGWPGFELGWTIAPAYQGRGYATEAARMLLRYAFDELDQAHVISIIHADNHPSRRVAEKLGQRVEGECVLIDTPYLLYGIRRE
jgi:RimJ/RimL family protein N-acetyltransferase